MTTPTTPFLSGKKILTYFHVAIRDKRVSDILNSTTAAPGEYDQLITDLKQRYDQGCQIHETHVMAIVKHPSIKGETRDELQSLRDMLHTNIRGLRNMDQFDAGAILTSLTVNKFTKWLRESCLEHTENTKQVPDVDRLIKFLDRKIQARSSTAETASSQTIPNQRLNFVNSQHFIVFKQLPIVNFAIEISLHTRICLSVKGQCILRITNVVLIV